MRSTQNEFWAVNMGPTPVPDPMGETEYLVSAGLIEGAEDGVLDHLVSTYDPSNDRLRMGNRSDGPVVLDFAPILVGETIALNGLLRRLFPLAERTAGCPVEIEFALDKDSDQWGGYRLCLLQMRPMMVPEGDSRLVPAELGDSRVVVAADRALGHGAREDIRDVVYLKPAAFDPSRTRAIAEEVAGFNCTLVAEGRPYVLIGEVWAAQGVIGQYAWAAPYTGGYRLIPRFPADVAPPPAFLPVTGGQGGDRVTR